MRLLSSVVLLTGALSVGAYAYLPVISFNHDNLANIVRIQQPAGRVATPAGGLAGVAGPMDTAAQSEPQMMRTFSPTSPLFARALAGRPEGGAEPQPATSGANAWRAVVTTEAPRPAQGAAAEYVASVDLARDLQRELKRVGCYEGDIDGDWRGASRRAMGAFLTKVNATLPTDRPDYILLTLLQGHADRACGVSCPSGQGVSSDGRCIPNVILAQGGEPKAEAAKVESRTETRVDTRIEARIGSGSAPAGAATRPEGIAAAAIADNTAGQSAATAPSPAVTASAATARVADRAARAAKDAGRAAASSAVVAAAVPSQIAQSALTPLPTPRPSLDALVASENSATGPRREPLPGRMAIGAPIAARAAPNADFTTGALPPVAAGVPPPTLPRLHRTARSAIDDAATESVAEPVGRSAAAPRVRQLPPQQHSRPAYAAPAREPTYARQQRYVRSSSAAPMVRTTQGKVRRGSPQHNLMLSLGGVF